MKWKKLTNLQAITNHRSYPRFDMVVGLALSDDSDGCAGGSVAIVGASCARQVKGDNRDEK